MILCSKSNKQWCRWFSEIVAVKETYKLYLHYLVYHSSFCIRLEEVLKVQSWWNFSKFFEYFLDVQNFFWFRQTENSKRKHFEY